MTASGGVSYLWQGTRLSADVLIGSGLRSDLVLPDGSSVPNGAHLPYYRQVKCWRESYYRSEREEHTHSTVWM